MRWIGPFRGQLVRERVEPFVVAFAAPPVDRCDRVDRHEPLHRRDVVGALGEPSPERRLALQGPGRGSEERASSSISSSEP